MTKAVSVKVTGRVQGVSFRWYTRQEAGRLGVRGWVRNEPDGSVAAHFEGDDDAVDALVAWAHHGPTGASVRHVAVRAATPEGNDAFVVRH